MSDKSTHVWYPEIMYEEDSKIPFIPVPNGEIMPQLLFMFESRDTGEEEPGLDGEPVPIVELDLYQYANMNVLKSNLSYDVFDEVRLALGLEPVAVAARKGIKVTEKVRNTIENS